MAGTSGDTSGGVDTAKVVVAVAYWRDQGRYPRADLSKRQGDVYLHNTATMIGTWRRVASLDDVSFVLCTNVVPTGEVGDQLDRLGVRRWEVPFDSRPPEGYYDRFSASTYSLDVLRAFADQLGPSDVLLLVDPDVVWVRDPAPLVDQVRRAGLVVKEIRYPPDHEDLGLTPVELTDLVAEMSGHAPAGLVRRVGGELVGATKAELDRWVSACDEAWAASVRRFEHGQQPRLNTEEHVFSYALEVLGYPPEECNTELLRRVWTRPGRLRNVRGDELDYVAWHALAEKGWGLWGLFDDMVAGEGAFAPGIDDDRYRHELATRLGVIRSRRLRLRHAVGMLAARVRRQRIGAMPG